MKKDAMALVTGKPVFTQDVAPADCLVVKVLRSPHANANILSIITDAAKKVPGIEAVYTWEDVPTQRFTMADRNINIVDCADGLHVSPVFHLKIFDFYQVSIFFVHLFTFLCSRFLRSGLQMRIQSVAQSITYQVHGAGAEDDGKCRIKQQERRFSHKFSGL